MILGIDTGGTFTDFVLYHDGKIAIHKVLSTPENPSIAILQGIRYLLGEDFDNKGLVIIHGSTVATNAALERKGVKTVYVANKGFKDVLSIGRQARRELYNLTPGSDEVPVPSDLCLEVDCRRDAQGRVVTVLSQDKVAQLVSQVMALQPEAVAINLLYSYKNDEEETVLERALNDHFFVSRSSFVLPEYKEFERGIATWLNAWLGPLVSRYLASLGVELNGVPISIMQSSGGTISLDQAAQRAVNLLLSGPAGGLAAARFLGSVIGCQRLITFDMGGTSSDVALIDHDIQLTNEGHIGPFPVAVPMVDMHTIGAGGGSIVWIDEGGMLQVGPRSAGANPGPACYGKGGTEATVTDANLLLGRLLPDVFLNGSMVLDQAAARRAMLVVAERLGVSVIEAAEGVIALANEHMVRALRTISVQRGYDPADFVLCAFGGSGGLHVCALAEAMGIHSAVVPVHSGVLSALGMVVAPRERQLSKTLGIRLSMLEAAAFVRQTEALMANGVEELTAEGVSPEHIQVRVSADFRYCGQSFTLNMPVLQFAPDEWPGVTSELSMNSLTPRFHALHRARYGHAMPLPVELVNVRVSVYAEAVELTLPEVSATTLATAVVSSSTELTRCPLLMREDMGVGTEFEGPLVIVDAVSTTYVSAQWKARRDNHNNLRLNTR